MNTDITKAIEDLVEKHHLAVEGLTEKQMAEAIEQAILSGDFVRIVRPDGAQAVTYLPFRMVVELREENEKLRGLCREAAETLAGIDDASVSPSLVADLKSASKS